MVLKVFLHHKKNKIKKIRHLRVVVSIRLWSVIYSLFKKSKDEDTLWDAVYLR